MFQCVLTCSMHSSMYMHKGTCSHSVTLACMCMGTASIILTSVLERTVDGEVNEVVQGRQIGKKKKKKRKKKKKKKKRRKFIY